MKSESPKPFSTVKLITHKNHGAAEPEESLSRLALSAYSM
jgi:hypothetical protein